MIARVMHWHLCKFFHISLLSNSWFSNEPLPVVENEIVKVLRDFGSFTNIRILNNGPDIVVLMRQCQHIMFVAISCPADVNVFEKEDEKISK